MLKKYLLSNFSQLFFPFFLVLFFIASVVLLISITGRTSVIKMDIIDLLHFFSYSLPGTIFFIIPTTLFAAIALSFARLSYDYEMLVFFSLGAKPFILIKSFLPIILLATLTMLIFSLCLVPLSTNAAKNFLAHKQADINVNLRSGELGQKIGDWLVYVGDTKNNQYEDLVLFSQRGLENEESFIIAKHGHTNNQNGIFSLYINNGSSYFAKQNEVKKMDFKQMTLRESLGIPKLHSYDLIEYWKPALDKKNKGTKRRLSNSILSSLFPLLSIFLLPVFGVANPRFNSNKSMLYVFGASVIYFVITYIIGESLPFLGLIIFPPIWLGLSYYLYVKHIKRYY